MSGKEVPNTREYVERSKAVVRIYDLGGALKEYQVRCDCGHRDGPFHTVPKAMGYSHSHAIWNCRRIGESS
jgi:hypothetical protein